MTPHFGRLDAWVLCDQIAHLRGNHWRCHRRSREDAPAGPTPDRARVVRDGAVYGLPESVAVHPVSMIAESAPVAVMIDRSHRKAERVRARIIQFIRPIIARRADDDDSGVLSKEHNVFIVVYARAAYGQVYNFRPACDRETHSIHYHSRCRLPVRAADLDRQDRDRRLRVRHYDARDVRTVSVVVCRIARVRSHPELTSGHPLDPMRVAGDETKVMTGQKVRELRAIRRESAVEYCCDNHELFFLAVLH